MYQPTLTRYLRARVLQQTYMNRLTRLLSKQRGSRSDSSSKFHLNLVILRLYAKRAILV